MSQVHKNMDHGGWGGVGPEHSVLVRGWGIRQEEVGRAGKPQEKAKTYCPVSSQEKVFPMLQLSFLPDTLPHRISVC